MIASQSMILFGLTALALQHEVFKRSLAHIDIVLRRVVVLYTTSTETLRHWCWHDAF